MEIVLTGARKAKRELLVKTALRLFYKNGFHATGIDTVLKTSGVAKMTLYNHFGSKDTLVKVALEEKSERVVTWIKKAATNPHQGPSLRLAEIFDLHEEWFASDNFHGCVFTKAAGEYSDLSDPIHQVSIRHYLEILAIFKTLCEEASLQKAALIGDQILVLLQGAITTAFVTGAPIAARRAKRAAEQLFI